MTFAHPTWLALLLLLPFLGTGALVASRLRGGRWSAFVAPRLKSSLMKRAAALPRWLGLAFLICACASLVIALARPHADAGTRTEKTLGRNVMIVLDISRSMRVQDVKPDRLEQSKTIIYELLEAMPNERIGFLAFAGSPYVYAPLTVDHDAVRETVEQIDERWAPLGGSDLAAAIDLATDTLKKTGQKNNALVVLSDGEEIYDRNQRSKLDEEAGDAERAGVFTVAIGVGTEDGDHVPNPDMPGGRMIDRSGQPVVSRLHTDSLRHLADVTHGKFAIAGSGLDLAALVKSVVNDMDTFEMAGRDRKVSVEFFQWLIFPAIVFLVISIVAGTRWRGIRTLATAAFLMSVCPVKAGPATAAKDALAKKNYSTAREEYRDLADRARSLDERTRYRLAEALAAYREGEFRDARTAYSRALLSEEPAIRMQGHLGIGNSLFQLGWMTLANEKYPTDPSAVPDLARFDDIVKEALATMFKDTMSSDAATESDSGGYRKMEALITNWFDSVKHYDSALAISPKDEVAKQNRSLTITYLKRLQELLRQEEQQARQALPQIMPGNGAGQGEGEGEGDGDKKDGQGGDKKDSEKKGGGGDQDKDQQSGKGGDKPKDKDGEDGKNGKGGKNPNESPEDRARRILKENADTEKGPLAPGRPEFRNAEKDW